MTSGRGAPGAGGASYRLRQRARRREQCDARAAPDHDFPFAFASPSCAYSMVTCFASSTYWRSHPLHVGGGDRHEIVELAVGVARVAVIRDGVAQGLAFASGVCRDVERLRQELRLDLGKLARRDRLVRETLDFRSQRLDQRVGRHAFRGDRVRDEEARVHARVDTERRGLRDLAR
jgi:hypothetical protein